MEGSRGGERVVVVVVVVCVWVLGGRRNLNYGQAAEKSDEMVDIYRQKESRTSRSERDGMLAGDRVASDVVHPGRHPDMFAPQHWPLAFLDQTNLRFEVRMGRLEGAVGEGVGGRGARRGERYGGGEQRRRGARGVRVPAVGA